MKVVLFGASGMVGQGVLRECLLDPDVDSVFVVGRAALRAAHPKLSELLVQDLHAFGAVEGQLGMPDACFFCLGVSSAGMTEPDYTRVTYDLTVAVAQVLAKLNPAMTFVYVSGYGTDPTEKGSVMWARVKGRTENALLCMPFRRAVMFRPAIIQPMHGVRSKTRSYRIFYLLTAPLLPLGRWLLPRFVTTTERVGRAMLRVARNGPERAILESADINTLGA